MSYITSMLSLQKEKAGEGPGAPDRKSRAASLIFNVPCQGSVWS
jgi:hypothetical protein